MAMASGSGFQLYHCEKCGNDQRVSIEDVIDQYNEWELDLRLQDINDACPLAYGGFFVASVKIDIECETCHEEIGIVLKVSASPDWDESREDCDPRIDGFQNTEILEVLPSDASVDDSLMSCLTFAEDDDEDYLPEIELSEEPTVVYSVTLHIIAKTRMNRGSCHLGLCFNSGSSRIFRPLYRTQESQCCWNQPLELDKEYNFNILGTSGESFTPLPHSNEDLLVDHRSMQILDSNVSSSDDVFTELQNMAKLSVEDIFGPNTIRQNKYVDEGSDCPSVGVLSCMGSNLEMIRDPFNYRKRRVKIPGGYEPRFTASDAENIPEDLPDNPTLVVLGLARPFAGTGQNHFDPKRCYILVLRILQNTLAG
ncbi:uncharacterized protein LOC116305007 [Actinia tenebrosa]|uniref:Uncharacterized protein LOC116305007 n=1 Tax=Actinia tenebrosa TaxID=6105 RepID=A0A6P8IXB7_ACTTE|nr:uncharacterized protein LOC116305007 [Actinia tenebrosa]